MQVTSFSKIDSTYDVDDTTGQGSRMYVIINAPGVQ
jgi:hypothetical protein